eukprot:scaffold219812_cov38-Tisochrysis_lutea.AAC.2
MLSGQAGVNCLCCLPLGHSRLGKLKSNLPLLPSPLCGCATCAAVRGMPLLPGSIALCLPGAHRHSCLLLNL